MQYPRIEWTAGWIVLLFLVLSPAWSFAAGDASGSTSPVLSIPEADVFATADRCMACHNQLATPTGEDVSIGFDWRASMMANASRDPYWHAAVRREIIDHPEHAAAIQHECAACHMPMGRYLAKTKGETFGVFDHLPPSSAPGAPLHDRLAADGVSCAMCHQIGEENLGTEESFTAGFVVDVETPTGQRPIYGPYEVDAGRTALMRSATGFVPEKSLHVQSSELCASCHTLYTHAYEDGEVVGRLPEQVPYLEWKHSAYPAEERSCQSCHMPVVEVDTPITGVLGQPRTQVSRHVFRGANFFVPRMLNRHRGELGVQALPQELDAMVRRTTEHLQTASAVLEIAEADLAGGVVRVALDVRNLAGHKLPSAYPSRRAWIHLRILDAGGDVVFESGAVRADGSIAGNDNDRDPARYEPHWEVVDSEEKVQIYEPILAGRAGEVTTGLLTAVTYAKDNRLLPRGFDKDTVPEDVAVHGAAQGDADFTGGGDRVVYRVDVASSDGPFRVEAELRFQPIGYRWAHNLEPYADSRDAMEIRRFVGYYEELSHRSSVVLAAASASAAAGSAAGP